MQRYDLVTSYRCGTSVDEMTRADEGEWVRWEDVDASLQEMAQELHAAINEPMYAGTRADWEYRARRAESALEDCLKRPRD